MRLVRQYRSDTKNLIFRISIFAVLFCVLIVLADRVAFIAATAYFDSRNAEHDNEILRQSESEPAPKALQDEIIQKQKILQRLSNEGTKRRVSTELARLYEQSGTNYIQLARASELKGNRSQAETRYLPDAEDSYQHAIAFAPFNAEYYVNLARLYYKVSLLQKDLELRCGLLRNAAFEYQDALDREPPSQKGALSQEASAKWLELAKLETTMPKHRMDAVADLQKALRLAPPGTGLAADINRTIRSLGTASS